MPLMTKRKSVECALIAVLGVAAVSLSAHPAAAAAAQGGGLPYESWLTSLRNSITGPVAYTVALISIVGAGAVLIFGGELNGFLRSLLFLVLTIGLVIGANNMMANFFGQGALIGSAHAAALGLGAAHHGGRSF